MASFDIIDAAGKGYVTAWQERRYLIRLAAVPLAVKALCYFAATATGWNDSILRQSLVMLPSYFTDGWMLAHLTRLILLGQRWPFRPSGDAAADAAVLQDRAEGILRGMLGFVTAGFLFTGLAAAAFHISQSVNKAESVPPLATIGIIAFLAFTIWGFRLLWIYVPLAVSYSLRAYIKTVRGFNTSACLMGTWLICSLPVFMVFRLGALFFMPILHALPGGGQGMIGMVLGSLFLTAMDTVNDLIVSIGITHGIRAMIVGKSTRSIGS